MKKRPGLAHLQKSWIHQKFIFPQDGDRASLHRGLQLPLPARPKDCRDRVEKLGEELRRCVRRGAQHRQHLHRLHERQDQQEAA